MSDYAEMTGPELVRAYNTMAASQTGLELNTKQVNRFATPEIGRKRCEMLASTIRAREAGLRAADRQEETVVATPTAAAPAFDDEERVMARATKKGPKTKVKANGIHGEFNVNPEKNNGKFLQALWDNKNKQLDWREFVKPVYGSRAAQANHRGALKMVWRGLEKALNKSKEAKANYKLTVERSEEGSTYGLHTKT